MKVLSLILSLILVFSIVSISTLAQEDFITGFAVLEEETVDAGITPDTTLYGLDLAVERIKLALTFNKVTKVKVELKNAGERLAETKLMIEEGNLEAAEKARVNHDKSLKRVKLEIEQFEDDDAEQELETEVDLETKIENHEEAVNELQRSIIKIKIKGELTEEQKLALTNLIESFQGSTGELKIEIKIQQGKTLTRVAAIRDIDKEEVEAEFRAKFKEKMEAKFAENKEEFAKNAIERAEDCITELEAVLNVTEEDMNDEEEDEEEIEVEVEIKGNLTEVEVEFGDNKFEFTLETTDMETIISEIVTRTGLTREQVEAAIEIESEEDEEEDDEETENSVLVLFKLSKQKLENAKSAFDNGNFGKEFGQANASYHLCVNALRMLNGEEVPEEEIEMSLETGDKVAVNVLPVDIEVKNRKEVSSALPNR